MTVIALKSRRKDHNSPVFSYFKSPKATNKQKDISISEYLALVSDQTKKAESKRLRVLPLSEYKKDKLLQPCITGSCLMDGKGRKKANIQSLNGLAVVDFDQLPTNYDSWEDFKTDLAKDQYSFIVHYSLSGRGLCVFVKIETLNEFKEIYLSFKEYYFENYEAKIDVLDDVTRLRFISFDPDYFFNPNSQEYTDTLTIESATDPMQELEAFDRFANMTASPDPATVFNNSGLVGAKLITSLLEQRAWSIKNGTGKEASICTRPDGQARSLVILNNEDVYKISVRSSNTGIAERGVYNLFEFYKKLTGFDDYTAQKELAAAGFGVFNEAKPIKSNGKESYSFTLDFIEEKHPRLNMLTGVIEFDGVPLNDYHISSLLAEASLIGGKNQSKEILLSCLDIVATKNQYHPFMEFVKSLEKLEPTDFLDFDELDKLIDCFDSDTPKKLIRIYLIRWMLGLFDLHVLNRMTKLVLALAGEQNACKTAFSKNILSNELKIYGKVVDFNPNKITDGKIALCSLLVACFDEFEEILTKHRTLADFKNLTASYDIFERRPYRRNHEQMFRASIVMATTNQSSFLNDSTGNTRFLTINVKAFDLEKYFKIDLDKVWRVIYDLHLQGETSVLSESERALQSRQNQNFEAVDPYSEMIEKIFKKDEKGFLTTTDIMQLLERETRQNLSVNRIGQALKKLGIGRISKRVAGLPKYGYPLKFQF